MKRASLIGLLGFFAAALSGCGSVKQKDPAEAIQAQQLFYDHRQQTQQAIQHIESRVSQQHDGSGS